MAVEKAMTTVEAGPVQISVHYVDQDGKRSPRNRQPEQGVSIRVHAEVDGQSKQLLRFDCFDLSPHYHYGPEDENEIVKLDPITAGNPIGWSVQQLANHLPEMIRRAGCEPVAAQLEAGAADDQLEACLSEVESVARDSAKHWRRTVTHNGSAELAEIPGTDVVEVGNIRFGLEFRELPRLKARGMAIHVLSDVAGQEIELLAFDCFDRNAHYHYGPRNRDMRHYWDRTLVPDPLRWVLDQFKDGKLPQMIEWAGYPNIAAEVDTRLLATKLANEIEPKALAIRDANVNPG